jgi:hypothetical protein
MGKFPGSLSIALWLTGSTWVVAILAYFLHASDNIVGAVFAFGLVAGLLEWIA